MLGNARLKYWLAPFTSRVPRHRQHAGLIHVWIQVCYLDSRNDQRLQIQEQKQIYEQQISGDKIKVGLCQVLSIQ